MIEDAVTYLTRNDDWVKVEVIGGGLLVLSGIITFMAVVSSILIILPFFLYPIAILVALPVGGYYIRVFRSTVSGSDTPPNFSDWGGLFRDGALSLIISIIYMIIPAFTLIVFVVILGLFSASLGTLSRQPPADPTAVASDLAGGLGVAAILTFILSFVVWLVFSYLLTIGLINFARKEDFGGAFEFSTIWGVGTTSDFLIGWLIGFVLFGTIAWFISWVVLANIPLIGFLLLVPLVMPFITFYITVSSNRLFATSFRKALE